MGVPPPPASLGHDSYLTSPPSSSSPPHPPRCCHLHPPHSCHLHQRHQDFIFISGVSISSSLMASVSSSGFVIIIISGTCISSSLTSSLIFINITVSSSSVASPSSSSVASPSSSSSLPHLHHSLIFISLITYSFHLFPHCQFIAIIISLYFIIDYHHPCLVLSSSLLAITCLTFIIIIIKIIYIITRE